MIVDAINDAIDLLNKLIGAYNAIPILGDIGKVGHIGGGGSGTAPGLGKFVDKRAAGGPVTAGRPYVVGEEGRELFVPGRSGRIIPNGALALAGGGGGVVNNYFSFPNYVGDKDELMRVVRQEAQRYKMRDGNTGLA